MHLRKWREEGGITLALASLKLNDKAGSSVRRFGGRLQAEDTANIKALRRPILWV